MRKLSRRDFLKTAALFSAGAAWSYFKPEFLPGPVRDNSTPNIIVILFDTMSARHLSTLGYERETTPNLTRLAERSTVYHSHYSAANFTSAGTATTLTGMNPWKHRAFVYGGMIKRDLIHENIFRLLGSAYRRVAFGQNLWADLLLGQFYEDVDKLFPPTSFSVSGDILLVEKFRNDRALAWHAFPDFITSLNMPASLVSGYLSAFNSLRKIPYYRYGFDDFPKGIPIMGNSNIAYLNEKLFEGLWNEVASLEKGRDPYFLYFHFFSPHEPYKVRKDFLKRFVNDDYHPIDKPKHFLGSNHTYKDLSAKRIQYDQLIANLDDDFGLLLDSLKQQGVLDNSYLVITSDHGQLFERGDHGHGSPLLNEPVIRIPLIISAPGQTTRQDIYGTTSNIDLVPTLLNIAGKKAPPILDGRLLPGFGGQEDNSRAIFSIYARPDSAFLPLTKTTIAMRKGDYKMIYYLGYPGYDNVYELYNIAEDPEEMRNLITSETGTAARMKDELLEALDAANKPFRRK